MIILGVSGKAGSGKDTACDYLAKQHGFQISLAAPLKAMVSAVFPKIPRDNLWGPSHLRNEPITEYRMSGDCPTCGNPMRLHQDAEPLERYTCFDCHAKWPEYLSARVALQTLGTDWGRRLYPDVWVDYLFEQVNPRVNPRVCISDVRFPNEVKGIVRNGGSVIRIERQVGELAMSSHESETGLDGVGDRFFSAVVRNDDTIVDLHRRLDEVIDDLLRDLHRSVR